MFNRKILRYFFLPILLLFFASCAVPIDESEPVVDEVQVYATVIRQVYTVDHTFGQPPNFPNIYLLKTNTLENQPSAQEGEAATTAADVAIIEALSDLPASFTWVTSLEDVPKDAHDTVVDGAVISVGPIHPVDDGSLQVTASIYFASLGAGGQTYVLEQENGVWTITGITGERWMS